MHAADEVSKKFKEHVQLTPDNDAVSRATEKFTENVVPVILSSFGRRFYLYLCVCLYLSLYAYGKLSCTCVAGTCTAAMPHSPSAHDMVVTWRVPVPTVMQFVQAQVQAQNLPPRVLESLQVLRASPYTYAPTSRCARVGVSSLHIVVLSLNVRRPT